VAEIALGLIGFAFGLALMSAAGVIIIHKLWDEPPSRIHKLADLFMAILNASAKVVLGPFELIKRIDLAVNIRPASPPLAPTEPDNMRKCVEGGQTMTKLLAAPENLHE